MQRCGWCLDEGILQKYHDEEWGNLIHDDRKHFEYLLMEAMQCGLNWKMMLNKRQIFKKCFSDFKYDIIANYSDSDIDKIMNIEGMIKSRKKIEAIINNAQCFIKVIKKHGSFDQYLWSFSEFYTYVYVQHQKGNVENKNELSDRISADMKKIGFKYLGSITIYSHLQACGIINDHECDCYKYKELLKKGNIKYIYD